MSVSKRQRPAVPTVEREYQSWRYGLEYRVCPSLLEAFTAGVNAAERLHPPRVVTVYETVYETIPAPPPPALKPAPTVAEALAVLETHGFDATARNRLSPREAQVLALILAEPKIRRREIGVRIWGENVAWVAQIRAVIGRLRLKLRDGPFCVGTLRYDGYHVHRIADGALCPPLQGGAHGRQYTPECVRARAQRKETETT